MRCVLKPIKLVLIWIGLILHTEVLAMDSPSVDAPTGHSHESLEKFDLLESLRGNVGITYFTFIYGPGIHPTKMQMSPNQLGKPENDGISAQNNISLRYKLSEKLALDFQNRFRIFFTNGADSPNFNVLRWEAPRIGLSGKLIYGDDWSLTGAINSDFPYFMPSPFTGYQAQKRTVIFNPGMFATFRYEPRQSRWSVFSVVSPRYFIYSDRNAGEEQMARAGSIPKPDVIIALQPTVSYQLSQKMKLTMGTSIEYRKQTVSNWNIFDATLVSNGDSKAWRLYAIPITLGTSYTFSPAVTIFPFISTYPIAIQRKDANTGQQAGILEATSVGMWINGTVF